MVTPCKDCRDRKTACWDTCQKYIEWKKSDIEAKRKFKSNAYKDADYNSYHREVVNKTMKRKNLY